ncbi:MAG TPA: DUF1576 domain-containing protein [Clostridiales bacterium]|jgi:hypothetical protein|nr:DUF1576 domain-containing protein [Clostridiales bacterium]
MERKKKPFKLNMTYYVLIAFSLIQIIFGLTQDTPKEIILGLQSILSNPDTLVSDYIGVGGIGASFVNSGLLTLMFLFMLYKMKHRAHGVTIAGILTISGFALFGKNLLNVWFVVFGVYLYSRYQKDNFSKYLVVALFGTALAPVATEIIFSSLLPYHLSIPLGILSGILMGFILPALATSMLNFHQGFNLYNIGFTSGLVGTVYVSILRSYGFVPEPRFIWTTGNNFKFSIFLTILFLGLIVFGVYTRDRKLSEFKNIFQYSGRLITDYVKLEGLPFTLINMGLAGLLSLAYILIIGGDLNGPTIGGIYTIVGFAAFGKTPKTIIPIFLGVSIGALTKTWGINEPAIQLAALFGTALAPIAGEFGSIYGILAAFVHSSVVLNVGFLHGGMNLYNNGFAAGIVAGFLLPIFEAFRKDED